MQTIDYRADRIPICCILATVDAGTASLTKALPYAYVLTYL